MPPAKAAVRGLTDSEVKLLCSLPGIESSILDVVKTLATFVTESADRETRLKNRIDDLSRQIAGLNEEVVALRESAIVAASASPLTPPAVAHNQHSQRTMESTAGRTSKRTRTRTGQAATCTTDADEHRSTSRSVGDPASDHETSTEDEDKSQAIERPTVKPKPLKLEPITDDTWKLVSNEPHRVKKAVIYVGNLNSHSSEESVKEFTEQRSAAVNKPVKVHQCSIHTTEDGKVSARLMIDATDLEIATAPNFWPRPLYARVWRHRERPKGDTLSGSHSDTLSDAPKGDTLSGSHSDALSESSDTQAQSSN